MRAGIENRRFQVCTNAHVMTPTASKKRSAVMKTTNSSMKIHPSLSNESSPLLQSNYLPAGVRSYVGAKVARQGQCSNIPVRSRIFEFRVATEAPKIVRRNLRLYGTSHRHRAKSVVCLKLCQVVLFNIRSELDRRYGG